MTFQEIQEKLKKCELALTSIKDGSYSNTKYTKEEALEKFNTIKESLEKKLNLLKEEESMFVTTKGGDTKLVKMSQQAARDAGKDSNITKITTAKGQDLKEDEYEAEDQTISTSHISLVSKEIHKALIDALQDTGHEVSEDRISSLNPQTFTIEVRFKDNTQSDYSFEVSNREVKIEGNIIVSTNKKGISPVLNKEIAKDNLIKYLKSLSEELDPVGEEDEDVNNDGFVNDTDKYLLNRRKAISKNIKEEDTEFEVDAKGKLTGNLKRKFSPEEIETLKKIEDLLAKEKKSKTTKEESLKEVNYSAHTKPKHFDICPGAESLRDELLDGGKTPEELGKWTYIHDELFKLEKDVLKSKKATDSDVKKAEQFASDLVNISRDLGIDAGKVNYLKGHVDKIKDVANNKEVEETKGAPKGHYFTKSGNLVKGRLTKDARERGARLSDPLDKQRSKVPPVTQYNEEEGENHERIVVPRSQLEDALEIIKDNIDGNHVKVTSGSNISGNGIIKFHFNPSYSNVQSYMYDTVMNLVAQDINVKNSTKYIDEALDHNDPVLMRARVAKMRADDMKKLDALKKTNVGFNAGPSRKEKQARALVQKLKAKRAEIEREMENDPDIEPTGGPVADMYGDQLNKIDNAIEKAASVYNKPMDYDTAVGKVSEDMDVGHVDDEPGMLKQDAYEIAQYSIQLFKLLKHYESLDVEVDFPNWWQRKVMLARDYISKATHYLDFKTNEPAIDSHVDALQEGRSAIAIKKDFDDLVDKMRKLAKHYKTAKGDAKEKILTALKQHTNKKKALEKELDLAVQKTGAGQELDTSMNELSGDQRNDLVELQNILNDAADLGEQAREIIRLSFPKMLSKADAYGVFDFGSSANSYDTTLASIIEEIEQYYDEEEDLDEIGMFHDPIRYSSTAAAEDKRALQLVKDLINKGVNKEDAIEKAAEKFKLRVDYLTRYVNKSIDEAVTHDFEEKIDQIVNHYFKGDQEVKKAAVEYASLKAARTMGGRSATASYFKDFFNNYSDEVANQAMEVIDMADDDVYQEGKYKSDAQRKAIYATKAEKGELKEEIDLNTFKEKGKQLFGYFKSQGYDITERSSDGRKPGFEGYQVSRGSDRYPQSVIFQYNKDTDEFTISRMSGYRIDDDEARMAKMKEKGRSGAAGMDSWMTDGNWTPADISAKGLKDIVDHVMSGLDRESKAQTDYYADRGRTSGTIDEGATCCGRCGRVHVKGSGCKRPYLKGKSHCRNK